MNCFHAFSALGCQLHAFALSSDWFIGLSASDVISQNDHFGFGSIEDCSVLVWLRFFFVLQERNYNKGKIWPQQWMLQPQNKTMKQSEVCNKLRCNKKKKSTCHMPSYHSNVRYVQALHIKEGHRIGGRDQKIGKRKYSSSLKTLLTL